MPQRTKLVPEFMEKILQGLPDTVKSVLQKTGASDADLGALDLLTGGASVGAPLMGIAAWKKAKLPREIIEALQASKTPMHKAINEKNVVYHATDVNHLKDILESGEILPGGLPTLLDIGSKGAEAGVSVSRAPRVNSKAQKAVSIVLDKDKMPRTRQFVEPDYGKTTTNGAINTKFEFEDRTQGQPIDREVFKKILVDESALPKPGSQTASMQWAMRELKAAEEGLKKYPGNKHFTAKKIFAESLLDTTKMDNNALGSIKDLAARFGLPVEVFSNGRAMHSSRALSALERKKK